MQVTAQPHIEIVELLTTSAHHLSTLNGGIELKHEAKDLLTLIEPLATLDEA